MARHALWIALACSFGSVALAANEPVAKSPAMAAVAASAPAATRPASGLAAYFRKNVTVEVTPQFLVIHSDGIPDHSTGEFPNPRNPNRILKQNYTFKIPLKAVPADHVTKLPMGPIGVAINGVPFTTPTTPRVRTRRKMKFSTNAAAIPIRRAATTITFTPSASTPVSSTSRGNTRPSSASPSTVMRSTGPTATAANRRQTSTSATVIATLSAAITTT